MNNRKKRNKVIIYEYRKRETNKSDSPQKVATVGHYYHS